MPQDQWETPKTQDLVAIYNPTATKAHHATRRYQEEDNNGDAYVVGCGTLTVVPRISVLLLPHATDSRNTAVFCIIAPLARHERRWLSVTLLTLLFVYVRNSESVALLLLLCHISHRRTCAQYEKDGGESR